MLTKRKQITPDIYLLFLDETPNWREDIVEKCGGKITGVYWFDATTVTHCCEITPSFELHFVESIPDGMGLPCETEEDSRRLEEIDDLLREGNLECEPVNYVHTGDVDFDNKKKCKRYWKLSRKEWKELREQSEATAASNQGGKWELPVDEQIAKDLEETINEAIHANTPY